MKSLNSISRIMLGIVPLLILFLLASCDDKTKMSDAQIASIVVTANQIDVDYGKLALEKSTNSIAKKYAETMIKDHEDLIKSASILVEKLGVTPDHNNDVTKSLLEGQKDVLSKLKATEGAGFDQAYMDNEVTYHQAVIDAVKKALIPQTHNEELKKALEEVTPLLEHHLEMAKENQSQIASGEGAIPQVTDPQVASIVVVANQIDVNYGKIALKKSKNKDVRRFAQTMINDHENIIKSAAVLAGKIGVAPDDDNAITKSLLDQEKETGDRLEGLSGDAFDKAYIDNEVAFHDAVISMVKTILIPQTMNEELKKALIDVSPLLEHHLEMAKEDQAKIK